MEKHSINVYAECPYDKISQPRITLFYATFDNAPPLQYHYFCNSYHDGVSTCQKCIAFFAHYIDRCGVPTEGQVITPQFKR